MKFSTTLASMALSMLLIQTNGVHINNELERQYKNDYFTEEELAKIKNAFNFFDINESGGIRVGELILGMNRLGRSISYRECSKIINELDTNGNRQLEFGEFAEMFKDP